MLPAVPRRSISSSAGEIAGVLRVLMNWSAEQCSYAENDYITAFERTFADYICADKSQEFRCAALSSGRGALELILKAMNLNNGARVLVPAYTFHAVPETIRRTGAIPVPVDIDPVTFNVDYRDLKIKAASGAQAFLATHLFGVPCDMDVIADITGRYGVKLIEDCAHCPGASWNGQAAGTFGDASLFSMETVKPFHTIGGGIAGSRNPELIQYIKKAVKELDQTEPNTLKKRAIAYLVERFTSNRAAFGLIVHPVFLAMTLAGISPDRMINLYKSGKKKARKNSAQYTSEQAAIGLNGLLEVKNRLLNRNRKAMQIINGLSDLGICQTIPDKAAPIIYQVVIRAKEREKLAGKLLLRGIDTGLSPATDWSDGSCSGAASAQKSALELPLIPTMSKSANGKMISIIREVLCS